MMKRSGEECSTSSEPKKSKSAAIDFNGYEHKDIVHGNRNCNPLKINEEIIEERLDWLDLDYEAKRALLQSRRVQVIKHNEIKLLYEESERMRQYLKYDPDLKLWPVKSQESQETVKKRYELIGKRIHNRFREEGAIECETDDVPIEFQEYKKKTRYEAPSKRIRITENLTLDPEFRIPVYSDIKGETVENCTVPGSLLFDYIERNVVDIATEEDLARAVEMSRQERNMIKCGCEYNDRHVCLCFENPDCQCYKMNLHLQKLQKVKKGEEAKFQAFNPIMFSNGLDTFFDNVGFSCSEICGCRGKCTNNVFFLIEKKQISFEIFRKNAQLGFEVRSPMFIPAGTPVMEFTGKIVQHSELEVNVMDYAMTLTFPKEDRKILSNIMKAKSDMSTEYKKMLKKLFGIKFHVDCKYQGNIGRFLCHSCIPNLELVRVYQKSFTPAHIRLILVALDDIFPRAPLTIDYGSRYYLPRCACGTFACKNDPNFSKFSKMSLKAAMGCCHDQWHFDFAENTNEHNAIDLFYAKKIIPLHRIDRLQDIKPVIS